MRTKSSFLALCSLILIFSCSGKKKKSLDKDYNTGSVTILTDDSFKSVTQALAEAYMINYPETKVDVKVMKEDLAFIDMLKDKAGMVVMSRPLSDEEKKEYERVTELKYQPANFAADGLVFVVPKNSTLSSITVDEIKSELMSDSKRLIFDGTNSGNLNFIAEKFGKKPSELKFSIISGNSNVIEQLSKYPDKIGVVSLNTISRPYGEEATKLREMVKILPVVDKGISYIAEPATLSNMTYPFTRVLYFLTNEAGFGISQGVIRFSCTQLGQIVVKKEGLQPYNIYKREVQMN